MPDRTVPNSTPVDLLARLHQIAGDLAVELDALDAGAAELTGPLASRLAALVRCCRECVGLVLDDLETAAAGLELAPPARRIVDSAVATARGLADVGLDGLPIAAQAAWARQCRPVLGMLLDELVPQPPTGPTISGGER